MADEQLEASRKRLRTSHACDPCRLRKTRCDGDQPCAACLRSSETCFYGSGANPRGKSDLILEGVLRVEQMLQQVLSTHVPRSHESVISSPTLSPARHHSHARVSNPSTPRFRTFSTSSSHRIVSQGVHHNGHQRHRSQSDQGTSFENAVLDSMHTSTTESVLHWPHFDTLPSLRAEWSPNLELERSRAAMRTRRRPTRPYVSSQRIESILDTFTHRVNFWYPTLADHHLTRIRADLCEEIDDGMETCLAFLTMALGCAAEVVVELDDRTDLSTQESERRGEIKALGDQYFAAALQDLFVAHVSLSSTAAHCFLFTALYFAFLSRPLQAWEYIHAAATKCLLLLARAPYTESSEDQERIRRIFWSCYMLESDYLAELSDLPQSGIAGIESTVSLPGTATSYQTHETAEETEQSCLYFLACLSMRRLLNRVHHVLYAKGTGAAMNVAQFPSVVAELHNQLEDWRSVLPSSFSFSVDFNCTPASTEAGGFLRQRYLTCRSVIFRPYLMWVLSDAGEPGFGGLEPYGYLPVNREVLAGCKECLDACLLHVLHLRGFAQTVLVDSWICSLSMAGAMLVLLAASRTRGLKRIVRTEVYTIGDRLQKLLGTWQGLCGQFVSPSAQQALRIVCEAHYFLSNDHNVGGEAPYNE